jgi:hypothetical protein
MLKILTKPHVIFANAFVAAGVGTLFLLWLQAEGARHINENFDWRHLATLILVVGVVIFAIYGVSVNSQWKIVNKPFKSKVQRHIYFVLINAIAATLLILPGIALAALFGNHYTVNGDCQIIVNNAEIVLRIHRESQVLALVPLTKEYANEFSYPMTNLSDSGVYYCRTGRAALQLAPAFNWPLEVKFYR